MDNFLEQTLIEDFAFLKNETANYFQIYQDFKNRLVEIQEQINSRKTRKNHHFSKRISRSSMKENVQRQQTNVCGVYSKNSSIGLQQAIIKTETDNMSTLKRSKKLLLKLEQIKSETLNDRETFKKDSDVILEEKKVLFIDLTQIDVKRNTNNMSLDVKTTPKVNNTREKRVQNKKSTEKHPLMNITYCVKTDEQTTSTPILNKTIVKTTKSALTASNKRDKKTKSIANRISDDLWTDDESPRDKCSKTTSAKKFKNSKSAMQVGENEKVAVKKQVEAFEKLGNCNVEKPTHMLTRTKKRLLLKNQTCVSGAKTATQIELKIRQDKQQEITKKHDMLLQNLIDEKKRKREEKELKVQQQKQFLEQKEKLKILEQQKCKEEKYKLMISEQEKKRQFQKQEAERKRLLAKQNAGSKKAEVPIEALSKRDMEMLLYIEKQKNLTNNCPKYLTLNTPLLPTFDCYDSDEEKKSQTTTEVEWSRENVLENTQFVMAAVGNKLKNTFFSLQPQTIDLRQIFEIDDPRILRRNSSAKWSGTPEYSLLPILESFDETDD